MSENPDEATLPMAGAASPEDDKDLPTTIDRVDHGILRLLAENGRLSARAIAREISMSPGAVSDRIDRLQQTGVIAGYRAEIDPAALGYGMEVVVALRTEQGPPLEETMKALGEIRELESVRIVTGSWDLLLTFRVRDHDHLRSLVLTQVWAVSGFRQSETMVVLQSRHHPPRWFDDPI